MAKDIGIGIAGTGLGAALLAINRLEDSRLQVRALYEPDAARSQQRYQVGKSLGALAQEFGVAHLAADYQALLADPAVDVVAIFSPCPLHAEQVSAALLAGKDVIVTKPMAVSLDEARRLVDLVDRTGRKLLVAQSMRWNSMFVTLHDLFTRGVLGDIHLAEGYYVHDLRPVFDVSPWRYELPQDLLYGGACHPIDLLRWFLGEADEVFCYAAKGPLEPRYPADKPDNFVISIRYRSGVIGRVLAAFDLVHPPALWSRTFHGVGLGLYGTKASLFNDRIVHDYRPGGTPREERIEPAAEKLDHAGEILGFLRHFEACLTRDEQPLVDVRDGAQVIAVCAACWESARSGAPAKVTREFDRG